MVLRSFPFSDRTKRKVERALWLVFQVNTGLCCAAILFVFPYVQALSAGIEGEAASERFQIALPTFYGSLILALIPAGLSYLCTLSLCYVAGDPKTVARRAAGIMWCVLVFFSLLGGLAFWAGFDPIPGKLQAY